ncbi:helix-turn-helix domain-containing protein [Rhodoplanes sp. Z2-YC6860]|uniref:helix-turn-helix domain-containing protein n=1 Tax=Rhodoplanes sp. Z2-YC6860 TaxID=674703 RepID=UPI0018DEB0DC|nr:helix-turn-helix domain-containing protein [Rhodoplanes sp. Z2-YC6860]
MNIWSTEAIRDRDRFSYWREALCQAVFNLSIEARPDNFSARITSRSSGVLRFVTSRSSGYQVVRTQRDIDTAPADHYSVFVQLHGHSVITQDGEAMAFLPSDIAISDGRFPFVADMRGDGYRAIAVIPREMVDRRAPWLRGKSLHKLASDRAFVDLANRHILELTAPDSTLSEGASGLLTENLCNLLALASANDVAHNRLQPELQMEAILAFCRQHLHDPELSPQRVADRFGISVRTLHLRFAQIGETFGRWLLEHRLDACSAALRDENQRGVNISDIAYRWGFNDLSHFNKVFRARFDQTPREWRNRPDI